MNGTAGSSRETLYKRCGHHREDEPDHGPNRLDRRTKRHKRRRRPPLARTSPARPRPRLGSTSDCPAHPGRRWRPGLRGTLSADRELRQAKSRRRAPLLRDATRPSRPGDNLASGHDALARQGWPLCGDLLTRWGEVGGVQASDVTRAVDAAVSTASDLDLMVDDAIVLHDSNKLGVRLLPCDVFARVAHIGHEVAHFEVEVARWLAETESPVAGLERRVQTLVYDRDGFAVTLWTYYEPV